MEVLIGHGRCHVIIETAAVLDEGAITAAIHRIAGAVEPDVVIVPQDVHLSENQADGLRCGDNGIFKGMPLTPEQKQLSTIARRIYEKYTSDGKYILDGIRLILCQSNASTQELTEAFPGAEINPLGDWTGGTDYYIPCSVLEEEDKQFNYYFFFVLRYSKGVIPYRFLKTLEK